MKYIAIATLLGVHFSANANILAWIAGSGNWSNPATLSPAVVPQNGNPLVSNNTPESDMTNDITSLSVGAQQFYRLSNP